MSIEQPVPRATALPRWSLVASRWEFGNMNVPFPILACLSESLRDTDDSRNNARDFDLIRLFGANQKRLT